MLDLGASELLLLLIVAVIVIGPKDLPLAMRTAGRWAGKVRRVSAHFRSGIDTMIREAELEEMEKRWKSQNEAIMTEHPDPTEMQAPTSAEATAEPPSAGGKGAGMEGEANAVQSDESGPDAKRDPQLPLPPP